MTQNLLIALAAGARAFADALSPVENCCNAAPEPAPAEPKTRKPRAAKEPTPAPEPPSSISESDMVTPAQVAEIVKNEEPATGDITDEQLKAAIQPLVQDGRTAEAKAVIKKYAESLTKIAPDKRKAFLADIEALSL